MAALLCLCFFWKTFSDSKMKGLKKSVAVVVMEPSEVKTVVSHPNRFELFLKKSAEKPVFSPEKMEEYIAPEVVEMIEEISDPQAKEDDAFEDFDDALDLALDVEEDPHVLESNVAEPEVDEDEAPAATENGEYVISIVIDDMGINQQRTKDIIAIQAPLTSSFLTYGKNLEELCKAAENAGHEVMLHAPMEPKVEAALAPDTLKIEMSDEEIKDGFLNMLGKFEGVDLKGINNHMGSRFTESAPKLDVVMKILKDKNMFFLDSKTSEYTTGDKVAALEGVRYLSRDVFLDNQNDYEYVLKQLQKLEKIALKQGYAVGIGHPKSATVEALTDWLKDLEGKPIKLVALSELMDMKNPKK